MSSNDIQNLFEKFLKLDFSWPSKKSNFFSWQLKKLHLNGVKVYFLCNYQWVYPLRSPLLLACSFRHPPRPIHFPSVFKGLGTRDKITQFCIQDFQNPRHFELAPCACAPPNRQLLSPKRHQSLERCTFRTLSPIKLCET